MMKKFLIFLLGIIVILFTMDSCMQFRLSKTEIDERFKSKNVVGVQSEYKYGKRVIHYAATGRNDGPLILFIHGSPGSLSDFIGFLMDSTLQNTAQLISVDRPGFGQSNFGRAEPSLEEQAKMIKPLIDEFKKDNHLILVGHSLGGPVIARIAADYPELVDGLIFVAGSVDPKLEPANWWRAPFVTPYFRWMVPRSIRASNDEIYPLKNELIRMEPLWSSIKAKTIVIHGTKDSLVPFANTDYIAKRLEPFEVDHYYEEGMDHFIPWSHPHLINKAIIKLINELNRE